MNLFFTLISFLAVVVLAASCTLKFKIPAAVAPVTAVGITMLYFSLIGCFGILTLGGYLYFALCAIAAIYLVIKKEDILSLFKSPSFIFFFAASILVILLFAYKKPLLMQWDEFSFWGTSVKLVKINSEMYTTAKIGWAWSATQKPALIMLGYFFEFFGSHEEWRICAGVNVFLFSVIASIAASFEKIDWHKAVAVIALAFLVPFAFTHYTPIQTPSSIYMSIMSDVPVGMAFAAALSVYYTVKRRGGPLWPAAITLGTLTMIKDTAFPIAMVAAGIMCVDIFITKDNENLDSNRITRKITKGFTNNYKGKITINPSQKVLKNALRAVGLFVTPILFFVGWIVYLAAVLKVDVTGDIGGTGQMGMAQMLIEGVKQLFGIGTTEKFTTIMGKMYEFFFTINLTVLGSGFKLFLIILVLLSVAVIVGESGTQRIRCISYALFSTLGFAAYYVFIGFCYVFVFKDIESQHLMSYERYIYPYYIGWFLGAVFLLATSIKEKSKRIFGAGQLVIFALIAITALRLSVILTPGKTFIDFNEGYLYERRGQIKKSESLQEYIPASQDSKIFFIGQGDDGGRWFVYSSDVLPLQLEYSFGGGTICLPKDVPEGTYYHIRITPEELVKYLKENECDYIFVERSDELLLNGFGHLFSDKLVACENNKSALYKVDGSKFDLVGEVE